MKNIATYRPYFVTNDGRPAINLLAVTRDKELPVPIHAFTAPISGTDLQFRSMNAEIERLVMNAPMEGNAMLRFSGSGVDQRQFRTDDAFANAKVKDLLARMKDGIANSGDILAACHDTLEREITPFFPDACLSFGDGGIRVESKTAIAARTQTARPSMSSALRTSRSMRNLHIWI